MPNVRVVALATLIATSAIGACTVSMKAGRSAALTSGVADTAALMKADRDFASDVARSGIEAWVSWFASDGQQLGPGQQVIGHAAIREYMNSTLSDPTTKLVWWPVSARIAASDDLGYTIGRYEVRHTNPDGTVTVRGTGRYLTIWHKQPDGTWRVDVDTGNPDPKPAQP